MSQSGPFPYIPPCKIQNEPNEESDDTIDGKNKKDEFVVPYWFVRSSAEVDKINMAASKVYVKLDGERVAVPVLTNTRKAKATECLLARKVSPTPPPSAQPSSMTAAKVHQEGKGKGKSGKKTSS